MGSGPGGTPHDLVAIAKRLIPAEGNDFGGVARGGEAERAFRARIGPLLHEDFVSVWPGQDMEAGEAAGMEATMVALRRIGKVFERLVALPERYVDLGDRVLVLLRREGRTLNGFEFSEEGAVVYVFEGALMVRMQLYAHREPALADTGLTQAEAEERGVPPDPAA